nr:cytidylate kinase family protein [uncultured Lachnoclostridium sp.]
MHITLTGNLGSGKSTICKILESKHHYEIYSTGKVQRKLAEDLGISVLEMNQLMCKDHKYDNMIDDTTAKISRENPDKAIVFDSRLAWNFVEKSYKVFLSVSLDVAASRVYGDNRGNVEKYSSLEDAKQQLKLRAQTEDIRYKDIYNLDYFNFSNYNLILDSTYCTPELLSKVILEEAKKYKENSQKKETKILMSPKRLGIEDAIMSAHPEKLYLEGDIVIEKTEEDYKVIRGMEFVKQAAEEGIPLVTVSL